MNLYIPVGYVFHPITADPLTTTNTTTPHVAREEETMEEMMADGG